MLTNPRMQPLQMIASTHIEKLEASQITVNTTFKRKKWSAGQKEARHQEAKKCSFFCSPLADVGAPSVVVEEEKSVPYPKCNSITVHEKLRCWIFCSV